MNVPLPSTTSLLTRLSAARRVVDDLFAIVQPRALYDRPIGERHRIVFYIGHVDAFDFNLVNATIAELPSVNPAFDKLFAFGIDPVGGGLPDDKASDWPTPEAVESYVRATRAAVDQALANALSRAATGDFEKVVNVAIEHRLMHAETLAYMFHWLPAESKVAGPIEPEGDGLAAGHRTVDIPAGKATLGRTGGFGWDNEFPADSVDVPAFAIDLTKITNAEFLGFLQAGGYTDRSLWSEEDWRWRTERSVTHPAFWVERNGSWFWRGMFNDRPLPLSWPVYVSHAEASAYARWKGGALPSEAQFHRAAFGTPDGTERSFPWGEEPPSSARGNFDFRRFDPTPVDAHPAGDSAFGVAGLVGNGWEWTSTLFAPLPGFQPFPFYRGYSADFFDGKHYVMKGGSMRTASPLLRRSFRNWFQPHYPYIYAAFRCVKG